MPNLRSLSLDRTFYGQNSMGSLQQLSSSLTRACFKDCRLPGSLSQLTGLQVLRVEYNEYNDCDEGYPRGLHAALLGALSREAGACLKRSLPRLGHLTVLWLPCVPDDSAVLAPMADLRQLQWLFLQPQLSPDLDVRSLYDVTEFASRLPRGAWEATLRRLVVPWVLAQSNLEFLAATEQLHHVSLDHIVALEDRLKMDDRPAWFNLWAWAETHPPLQKLDANGYEVSSMHVLSACSSISFFFAICTIHMHHSVAPQASDELVRQMYQLPKRRPTLCFELIDDKYGYHTDIWNSQLWAERE